MQMRLRLIHTKMRCRLILIPSISGSRRCDEVRAREIIAKAVSPHIVAIRDGKCMALHKFYETLFSVFDRYVAKSG